MVVRTPYFPYSLMVAVIQNLEANLVDLQLNLRFLCYFSNSLTLFVLLRTTMTSERRNRTTEPKTVPTQRNRNLDQREPRQPKTGKSIRNPTTYHS